MSDTMEALNTPMANRAADRWSPGIALSSGVSGPMQAIGGLFAMSADAVRFIFRKPFQWREFLEQAWFVARVSLAPTLLVAIPFTVLVSFTLNILLRELGEPILSFAELPRALRDAERSALCVHDRLGNPRDRRGIDGCAGFVDHADIQSAILPRHVQLDGLRR